MNICYQRNDNILLLSLSLCGWRYENVYSKMRKVPDIYVEIQDELTKSNFNFEVFDEYFSHRNPYWFFRWVLKHSEIPEYELNEDAKSEELAYYENFDKAYLSLGQHVELKHYKKKVIQLADEELNKYQKRVPVLIDKANELLPVNKDISQIIIYPNYLAVIGSGFAIWEDKTLKIIAGPPKDAEEDLSDLLLHEYLHSIINPLVNKHYDDKDLATPAGVVDDFYQKSHPKYKTVLSEYIIRALVVRILDSGEQILREKNKRGFAKMEEVSKTINSYKNLKTDNQFCDMLNKVNEILLKVK